MNSSNTLHFTMIKYKPIEQYYQDLFDDTLHFTMIKYKQ